MSGVGGLKEFLATSTPWRIALLCLPLALLSMGVTSFQFGVNNNIIHIPYVLGHDRDPAFAGNAFYQSLHKFVSGFWPLLRLVATESNVQGLFLASAVLSRWLALVGVAWVLQWNGVTVIWQQLACLAVIASTPLMTGYSPIGSHGLFVNYFTHSELTWPFVFASLACLQRGRLAAAAFSTGVAFILNAFVGVWLLVIHVVARCADQRRGPTWREAATFGAVFAALALPVALWIGAALSDQPSAPLFSFIDYIRAFYPNHFLIEAADGRRFVALVLFFGCGLLGSLYMASPRFWIGVQAGVFLLLAAGAVLPYLLNARLVFNLHLLRADGIEQAVSVVLCAIAAVKLLGAASSPAQKWMGVVVLSCLVGWPKAAAGWALPVVCLALFAGLSGRQVFPGPRIVALSARFGRPAGWMATAGMVALLGAAWLNGSLGDGLAFRIAFVAAAATALGSARVQRWATPTVWMGSCIGLALCIGLAETGRRMATSSSPEEADWRLLQSWVRESPLEGEFLVPLTHADYFQLNARRPVWVGARQGAAVMWEPRFHDEWRTREREVTLLGTPEEYLAYAREKRIPYVVLASSAPACGSAARAVYRAGHLELCQLTASRRPATQ